MNEFIRIPLRSQVDKDSEFDTLINLTQVVYITRNVTDTYTIIQTVTDVLHTNLTLDQLHGLIIGE